MVAEVDDQINRFRFILKDVDAVPRFLHNFHNGGEIVKSATEILQGAGIVTTRQRVVLLDMLLRRDDHPDAERLLVEARVGMPSLSVDTVYRTLNLFVEAGVIQRMAVPTRRARFDGCTDPHDHFLCSDCETIQDIPRPSKRAAAIPAPVKACGMVSDVQTVYVGVCRRCAAQKR